MPTSSYINRISYYLPSGVLTNEQINADFPEWSVEKISKKTGIYQRTIAATDETSGDMAVSAARKLFDEHGVKPDEIDFLLLCTQSPDYFLPTTACIVQDKLGLRQSAGALDFNLGCSGFVYGLGLAKGLIETGQAKNVLLITSETYSKFVHPKDKSVKTIFGDAAAASLISGGDDSAGKIHSLVFGTDGAGAKNLIVKTGGMRARGKNESLVTDDYGNVHDDNSLYMNGMELFVFTLKIALDTLNSVLEKAKLQIDDVDLFVFHQANKYMLDELRKKLKIPEAKFYTYFENCGNTVSSTIPIALYHALEDGRAKAGDKIMLMGFGVGYSWAGAIVEL